MVTSRSRTRKLLDEHVFTVLQRIISNEGGKKIKGLNCYFALTTVTAENSLSG